MHYFKQVHATYQVSLLVMVPIVGVLIQTSKQADKKTNPVECVNDLCWDLPKTTQRESFLKKEKSAHIFL